MPAAIIRTERLTKTYGAHRGITDVNLEVQAGEVFGFLGPNGAGKTTTIRTLLDLIRPTSGKAFVFDIETTVDPVAIHRRIGYIPGEFALYDRLTGGQTIQYFANLRGGVDPAYRDSLIERLGVDPTRRFKEYSKGNKQKVGLVIALQHRPELLILDEPTSGLDPLVQQGFYELMREAQAEGRTVFLSSHILSEVERTCDRVAIIRDGRLVKVDRTEALRDLAHHEVELRFSDGVPADAFASLPGVSDVKVDDHTLRMRVSGPITPVVQAAARYDLLDFVSREPTLEETFLAQYGTTTEPMEAKA
jgi:ABC-2 type transport system ATP-binding protein